MKVNLLLFVLLFLGASSNAQSLYSSPLTFEENISDAAPSSTKLTVYPNPSTGNISLAVEAFKGEQVIVMVFDMNQRMVAYRRMEDCNEYSIVNFDLTSLGKGLYIIKVGNGQTFQTQKFLIRG